MFDKTLRTLKSLNGQKFTIDIEADDDGYIDRECPAENCTFLFKVKSEDWDNLFKDEAVYCPMCRHETTSENWDTTEQVEQAKEQALKFFSSQLDKALEEDAKKFNSSQKKNSFLKMSMSVKGLNSFFYKKPIPAMEEMALKVSCEKCGARYAVIGSAFFCPCCGHNSVEQTIDASLKKVELKLDNLNLIKQTFIEQGMKDEAEIMGRSLIESCIGECVVAFQRYCEEVYSQKAPSSNLKKNVFQRIDDGSKLWSSLIGEGYSDWLDSNEFDRLKIYFNQRHLLAHKEGLVDAEYISKTNDATYRAGQRIVVKEASAREFLAIIQKLITAIRRTV